MIPISLETRTGSDPMTAPVTSSWTVGLDLEGFAAADREIVHFLDSEGVEGRAAYVSNLVVEEVVLNLIEHTPPYAHDETATVTITVAPAQVQVTIEDQRPPFAPGEAPALDVAAPLEERRVGGMGLHLVRSMTDELSYERVGERNRLVAVVSRT